MRLNIPMPRVSHRFLRSAALLLITVVIYKSPIAKACGPYFENWLIEDPDAILDDAPAIAFGHLIDMIESDLTTPHKAVPPESYNSTQKQSHDQATKDYIQALKLTRLSEAQQAQSLAQYKKVRAEILKVAHRHANYYFNVNEWHADKHSLHFAEEYRKQNSKHDWPAMPEHMPKEFRLYLQGAMAWYVFDYPKARHYWTQILQLPERQRRFREAWARFMIARTYMHTQQPGDHSNAIKAFEELRDRIKNGLPDPTGLAAASYGLQAQISHKTAESLKLYYLQHLTGDKSALSSMRIISRSALEIHVTYNSAARTQTHHENVAIEQAKTIAQDPLARQIITAYVYAGDNPIWGYDQKREHVDWAGILAELGIENMQMTDYLALIAYRRGKYHQAVNWLKTAPEESILTHWVKAKLALRSGEIKKATTHYATALSIVQNKPEQFQSKGEWYEDKLYFNGWKQKQFQEEIAGELALLKLHGNDFTNALNLFLQGDYWEDATYIAERLTTSAELKNYVDLHHPMPDLSKLDPKERERYETESRWAHDQYTNTMKIRFVLARRLFREGKFKQARPYFPKIHQAAFDDFIRYRAAFSDYKSHKYQRGEAYAKAAVLLRFQGENLMATEAAPDWRMYHMNFDLGDGIQPRLELTKQKQVRFKPTQEEIARANRPVAVTMRRFHYRYVATQYAWMASKLLPNNSREKALILWRAGYWMRHTDAEITDRFYKTLARTCPDTVLGKSALKYNALPTFWVAVKAYPEREEELRQGLSEPQQDE